MSDGEGWLKGLFTETQTLSFYATTLRHSLAVAELSIRVFFYLESSLYNYKKVLAFFIAYFVMENYHPSSLSARKTKKN